MILGKLVELRPMTLEDVDLDYLDLMNDLDVISCLESRFEMQTYNRVRSYVETSLANPLVFFYAICSISEGKRRVGQIKLGPINVKHRFSEIGLVIGRPWWGKGYGSEALKLVSDFGFSHLGLHKIFGGILEGNEASMKAFEKAGFRNEAVLSYQYWNGKEYIGDLIYSRFAK